MKPILFTKENRELTRTGAKTQTRRVIADGKRTPYTVGDVRYMCEPYVINSAEHTSKRQVIGEYLDDGKPFNVTLTPAEWDRWTARKQPYAVTQARFMYKTLARTFVEITDLRREPLQDIREKDAKAEGVVAWHDTKGRTSYIPEFRLLWDSINAARGFAWDTNPTVLVVEYKVVTP